MNRTWCRWVIGLWSVVALASNVSLAQDAKILVGAAGTLLGTGGQPSGRPANQWRYRYHNGQWWYYQPNNQWSYWNGNAWIRYNRQPSGLQSGGELQPYTSSDGSSYDAYGRRVPGTIQREKNAARTESLDAMGLRSPGTIQREKNAARTESLESMGLRSPGTIQREKNDARSPLESSNLRPPGTIQREKNDPRG